MKKKATLTQLRELRNMTQEELAFKAGITSRTLISYENDVMKLRKASYERLKRIADALDCSVDDIFLDDISVFLKLPYISRIKTPYNLERNKHEKTKRPQRIFEDNLDGYDVALAIIGSLIGGYFGNH